MKALLLIISIAFVMAQGCTPQARTTMINEHLDSIYNIPSSGKSEFDDSKFIRMSNVICKRIMFELYQDTAKAEAGLVLLAAGPKSAIVNIGKGKSLLFKIDGEIYEFESDSVITEHKKLSLDPTWAKIEDERLKLLSGDTGATTDFSYKNYLVSEEFVRKAAAADVILIKMYMLNNEYIEGKCSVDLEYSAGTFEGYDIYNSPYGIYGFRKFVKIMDSTVW